MPSRRSFLKGLFLAPAIPVIDRLVPVPMPEIPSQVVPFAGKMPKPFPVPTPLIAHGGFCAPLSPTYELRDISAVNWPIWENTPLIKPRRGTVKFVTPS